MKPIDLKCKGHEAPKNYVDDDHKLWLEKFMI